MIVEISTSILVGGLTAYCSYQKAGGANDAAKIQRIFTNCGLTVKENGQQRTMQLLRRTRYSWGMEYAYRIPLGLSFFDFEKKRDHVTDGLNNKRNLLDLTWNDLKGLKWDSRIVQQLKELLLNKKQSRKEVEMSYDGVLKIKVFNEPLTTRFDFEQGLTKGWAVPVGESRSGLIIHDFEKKAHIIVAGTTDFGKSNWVNCVINTLLLNKGEDVTFTLIDLKGGLEFNRYRFLNQVKAYATDVEKAREALKSAVEKMDEVTEYLLEKGFSNVKEAGFKERHFIIIDEAADMADDKACQELLKDIARKGRASGLRLVYTTQYPTVETISSQVKRNCIGRLCFVLDTATASQVVLDQGGAEKLPAIQGRALYKDLHLIEVQTPYITGGTINENIQPHIRIRPRKERVDSSGEGGQKGTEGRKYTLVVKET
jgi:DNA segregation ATPase FtsK/SpoIIIE, S-DNA-T family